MRVLVFVIFSYFYCYKLYFVRVQTQLSLDHSFEDLAALVSLFLAGICQGLNIGIALPSPAILQPRQSSESIRSSPNLQRQKLQQILHLGQQAVSSGNDRGKYQQPQQFCSTTSCPGPQPAGHILASRPYISLPGRIVQVT